MQDRVCAADNPTCTVLASAGVGVSGSVRERVWTSTRARGPGHPGTRGCAGRKALGGRRTQAAAELWADGSVPRTEHACHMGCTEHGHTGQGQNHPRGRDQRGPRSLCGPEPPHHRCEAVPLGQAPAGRKWRGAAGVQRLDLEIVESAPERSESAHRRRLQTRAASGVLACSQTAGRGELWG